MLLHINLGQLLLWRRPIAPFPDAVEQQFAPRPQHRQPPGWRMDSGNASKTGASQKEVILQK
jgi:hypothetical protein